ncbi:His-Xaa-Ser system radical SAM maturase HxsC [Sporomusa acidovorans]|uniref:His-Xaa-Ser system radical SAM maturase HxsC n=1 Tax=Sporomusa acidovorans TaxID=112900 RepID=UPI00087E1071|nr:His-Xaa-Ser system radical SAM maturase HxsC [Sporomusa acidovorans]OZC18955.1 cyclic pyranopterin monophosphate synthase [Sporomusa acidovorans DSM 3132]SDD70628.1 His-Xaa-Ser system radical SAM maturase HxsC [Sporomusa acidovorans]
MIALNGNVINIKYPIVGIVTTTPVNLLIRHKRILVSTNIDTVVFGYACCITSQTITSRSNGALVHSVSNLELLNDGDIVLITPEGRINIMFQSGHDDHTVFITNRCNSRCIMCPQPPSDDPPDLYDINEKVLSLIKKESLKYIGITGGEPTVVLDQLTQTLSYLNNHFPDTFISLLTNGRRFQDFDVARQVVAAENKKLLFCIPIYADNDVQHDGIVGIKGAFQDTIQGIYNLYRLRRRIEIRIVVVRQNFTRIVALSEFIYRNLPFVAHIAFMGMEYTGKAEQHLEDLWIDPREFSQQLYEAVWLLHLRNMNVSIYNIPLCLLEKPLWGFARDSISRWKKNYLDQCTYCSVKARCCGIFETSCMQSTWISPQSNGCQHNK